MPQQKRKGRPAALAEAKQPTPTHPASHRKAAFDLGNHDLDKVPFLLPRCIGRMISQPGRMRKLRHRADDVVSIRHIRIASLLHSAAVLGAPALFHRQDVHHRISFRGIEGIRQQDFRICRFVLTRAVQLCKNPAGRTFIRASECDRSIPSSPGRQRGSPNSDWDRQR